MDSKVEFNESTFNDYYHPVYIEQEPSIYSALGQSNGAKSSDTLNDANNFYMNMSTNCEKVNTTANINDVNENSNKQFNIFGCSGNSSSLLVVPSPRGPVEGIYKNVLMPNCLDSKSASESIKNVISNDLINNCSKFSKNTFKNAEDEDNEQLDINGSSMYVDLTMNAPSILNPGIERKLNVNDNSNNKENNINNNDININNINSDDNINKDNCNIKVNYGKNCNDNINQAEPVKYIQTELEGLDDQSCLKEFEGSSLTDPKIIKMLKYGSLLNKIINSGNQNIIYQIKNLNSIISIKAVGNSSSPSVTRNESGIFGNALNHSMLRKFDNMEEGTNENENILLNGKSIYQDKLAVNNTKDLYDNSSMYQSFQNESYCRTGQNLMNNNNNFIKNGNDGGDDDKFLYEKENEEEIYGKNAPSGNKGTIYGVRSNINNKGCIVLPGGHCIPAGTDSFLDRPTMFSHTSIEGIPGAEFVGTSMMSKDNTYLQEVRNQLFKNYINSNNSGRTLDFSRAGINFDERELKAGINMSGVQDLGLNSMRNLNLDQNSEISPFLRLYQHTSQPSFSMGKSYLPERRNSSLATNCTSNPYKSTTPLAIQNSASMIIPDAPDFKLDKYDDYLLDDDEDQTKFIVDEREEFLVSKKMLKKGYIYLNGNLFASDSAASNFWSSRYTMQESITENNNFSNNVKKILSTDEKALEERIKINEGVLLAEAKKFRDQAKKILALNYIPAILTWLFSCYILTEKYFDYMPLNRLDVLVVSILMFVSVMMSLLASCLTSRIIKRWQIMAVLIEKAYLKKLKGKIICLNAFFQLFAQTCLASIIIMVLIDISLKSKFYGDIIWNIFEIPEMYILLIDLLISTASVAITSINTIMYNRLSYYWLGNRKD